MTIVDHPDTVIPIGPRSRDTHSGGAPQSAPTHLECKLAQSWISSDRSEMPKSRVLAGRRRGSAWRVYWRRRGGTAKHFEDPVRMESVRPKVCASWWPQAQPGRTPHGRLDAQHTKTLCRVSPRQTLAWGSGRAAASCICKKVESDRTVPDLGFLKFVQHGHEGIAFTLMDHGCHHCHRRTRKRMSPSNIAALDIMSNALMR